MSSFSAETALFHTTERRRRIRNETSVEPNHPAFHLTQNPLCCLDELFGAWRLVPQEVHSLLDLGCPLCPSRPMPLAVTTFPSNGTG
jgi:hypothetical protein